MIDQTTVQSVRITCAPGLAPYLEQELASLGHEAKATHTTHVDVEADMQAVMQMNLQLRTAFNVLVHLSTFPCADPDDLYGKINDLPWETMIPSNEYLSIVSSVNHPTISDWRFASLTVKDAIVDRLADATGERPDSGPSRENVVIHLYWHGDTAQLFLNASGRKLADRNYRKMPHKAPMQETLAAGVLMGAGYDGTQPLVNPMCGSGTLAIEAALVVSGRVPGLLRDNFGFMHIQGFNDEHWQAMRREAKKVRAKGETPPIIATDIDEKAIRAARKNAETAGVHHLIQFDVCEFADTAMPDADTHGKGIVIMNPEYGVRLGDANELQALYKRMGDFFKQRCAGWTGYIFTGNLDLAKKVGLRASRRMEFFNAKIDCRLLKYELYEGTRRSEKGS
ncbi:MAG: THUMP domain-containing class I SAM-dependent RNA methyltransferase [Phycisphaerae bacterium]